MALPCRYQRHWKRFLLLGLLASLVYLFLHSRLRPTSKRVPSPIHDGASGGPSDAVQEEVDIAEEEDISRYAPGGYHPVLVGDAFRDGRYVVQRKIGRGEFATVWLSKDIQTDEHVALKILTSNSSAGHAEALDEIALLQNASTADPAHPGFDHVITLRDHFTHNGVHGSHICLVFDMLGRDLYKLTSYYRWEVPMNIVKTLTRQMLLGLDYLHTKCGIIHSDFKQDNMLIEIYNAHEVITRDLAERPPVSAPSQRSTSPPYAEFTVYKSQPLPFFAPSPENLSIKIVDLGVSNWIDKYFQDTIQSPALRAPEVVLGAPWSTPVDIWSAGCMVYFLLMGVELFNPSAQPEASWSEDEEHLAQMIERFGPISPVLVRNGKWSPNALEEDGTLLRISGVKHNPDSLRVAIADAHGDEVASDLADFLRSMFRYDPDERATAKELLQHPFLREE